VTSIYAIALARRSCQYFVRKTEQLVRGRVVYQSIDDSTRIIHGRRKERMIFPAPLLMDGEESFHLSHLRTLQRRVREWRALNGPDIDVNFRQKHKPGKQSQSDWTHCEELNVTIDGAVFFHMLFRFMLPYSRWEAAYISFSENRQKS
jgi:hypothetical protein